jgi:hypothetical protein
MRRMSLASKLKFKLKLIILPIQAAPTINASVGHQITNKSCMVAIFIRNQMVNGSIDTVGAFSNELEIQTIHSVVGLFGCNIYL